MPREAIAVCVAVVVVVAAAAAADAATVSIAAVLPAALVLQMLSFNILSCSYNFILDITAEL